jgi:hypothetical protein
MKLVMEMKRKHPNFSLGEAMKEAKKHYHPAKTAKKGGFLQKTGGRRRHTAVVSHRLVVSRPALHVLRRSRFRLPDP